MSTAYLGSEKSSYRDSKSPVPMTTPLHYGHSSGALPASRILDRPLNRIKHSEANFSLFALLFSEIVQSSERKFKNRSIAELEVRLNEMGQHVGKRLLELYFWRERPGKREPGLVSLLQLIHSSFYKFAFGKPADCLEVSLKSSNEYMITDNDPITNRFISVPKDKPNPAAWMSGVLEGAVTSSGFKCQVTAHSMPQKEFPHRVVFLLKFEHV